MFDHEKLHVYRLSLAFVRWTVHLVGGLSAGCRNARIQLVRSSDSIPLNIAEGNGKRPGDDRKRYLEIARSSATECAATLDVLVARGARSEEQVREGKVLLYQIVAILLKLAPPGR